MKKALLIVGAFAIMFSFQSCKKDYTCTCTVLSQTVTIEYTKVKKADAEDSCSAAETTYKTGDSAATCELK